MGYRSRDRDYRDVRPEPRPKEMMANLGLASPTRRAAMAP